MAHDRTIPDRSESATWLASQLARSFTRALHARAAKLGFSPGQFPILIELWEEEGLTQRQLLDRVDVEQATIANTLSRMERDGLIERRVHPTDKRAQQIFLTAKARDMREDALAAADEAEQAVFRGFRRFEKELLKEYIRWAIANARKL
ncbi:MAG: MarR family winged helix-turn-helix transcriptional regulator [Rhizobium rhizophilum]|uniref:MarR family winged helix-turn-helix transcriptional regulator n=1 Tax=Rhizobium rhizophilum TaxID=1850373 RepID=UPI003918CF74